MEAENTINIDRRLATLDLTYTSLPDERTAPFIRGTAMIFLKRNPQVLADIDRMQEETGAEVVFAVVPKIGLVVGRCGDQLRAVFPRIVCTRTAMRTLVVDSSGEYIKGYDVFANTVGYDELRDSLLQKGLGRDIFYNKPFYDFSSSDSPQNYIAAQLEGCIIEGATNGDELVDALLERTGTLSLPFNPSVDLFV